MDDLSGEIRRLRADVGRFPAELRKQLRPALKTAAEPIAADARARASWSTRIPGAITVRARFGARDPGVSLRVLSSRAPHGRVYEGIRGNAVFRHPVFGHRDRWVEQPTRPYAAPAVEAGADEVASAAAEAVTEAARDLGFR